MVNLSKEPTPTGVVNFLVELDNRKGVAALWSFGQWLEQVSPRLRGPHQRHAALWRKSVEVYLEETYPNLTQIKNRLMRAS